jgi:hypothetical protein
METMNVERIANEDGVVVWKAFVETFDLETDFAMNEDNLSKNICQMGHLLARYGTISAEQDANLKRKEEAVKFVKANVAGALRSQAEANGTKMTENKLDEAVTVNPLYQQVLAELHVLRANALKADHWWRAILKKSELLNAMTFRQSAELKRMPG